MSASVEPWLSWNKKVDVKKNVVRIFYRIIENFIVQNLYLMFLNLVVYVITNINMIFGHADFPFA
jgi:hypothetical protein